MQAQPNKDYVCTDTTIHWTNNELLSHFKHSYASRSPSTSLNSNLLKLCFSTLCFDAATGLLCGACNEGSEYNNFKKLCEPCKEVSKGFGFLALLGFFLVALYTIGYFEGAHRNCLTLAS